MSGNKKEADLSERDWDNLVNKLKRKKFTSQIFFGESVDSTNDFLADRANKVEEGSMAIAKKQKKGKGRGSHKWESPKGGLWFSILLKPKSSPHNSSPLTVMIGVQLALDLGNSLDLPIKTRWPNDLILAEKKLGGILLESQVKAKKLKWLVVGLGVNVNNKSEDLPPPLNETSISLSDATGSDFDLTEILTIATNSIKKAYRDWLDGKSGQLERKWREVSSSFGKTILFKKGNSLEEGKVVGLNSSAELIVKNQGCRNSYRAENAQIEEIFGS